MTALPSEASSALEALGRELRAEAGDNLFGIILYGGLARGRYFAAVNTLARPMFTSIAIRLRRQRAIRQ